MHFINSIENDSLTIGIGRSVGGPGNVCLSDYGAYTPLLPVPPKIPDLKEMMNI